MQNELDRYLELFRDYEKTKKAKDEQLNLIIQKMDSARIPEEKQEKIIATLECGFRVTI